MNAYKDRGIIKWSPFDGLSGFVDMMEELRYKLGKKEKPMLLEDKLEDMDFVLKDAIRNQKMVYMTYYKDGYLYPTSGYITHIDILNRTIKIDHQKFNLDDLMDLMTSY